MTFVLSVTSSWKVVSELMDLIEDEVMTSSSSIPFAICHILVPYLPKISVNLLGCVEASWPIDTIPTCVNNSELFLPTPLIFVTERGSRNSRIFCGGTLVKPSGFLKSEAIFAIALFGRCRWSR